MSDQNPEHASADELAALVRTCAKIKAQSAAGQIDDIPDAAIAALMSTATLVYSTATHEQGRRIQPFSSSDVTATSVVVTVKAMLQAADLSSFDLAMWSNRL